MTVEYFSEESQIAQSREWIRRRVPGLSYLGVPPRYWHPWISKQRFNRGLSSEHRPTGPQPSSDPNVAKIFRDLEHKWLAETTVVSSVTDMVLNQHYQSIIGLGPAVVPILLESLRDSPQHWFWALQAITRVNPVPDEDEGDMKRMAEAWLAWGRHQELL